MSAIESSTTTPVPNSESERTVLRENPTFPPECDITPLPFNRVTAHIDRRHFYVRACGFAVTPEQAIDWVTRHHLINLPPGAVLSARSGFYEVNVALNAYVRKKGFRSSPTRINDKRRYLLVTQMDHFPQGYPDIPEEKIPKFTEGDEEASARKLLKDDLGLDEPQLVFKTVFSSGNQWLDLGESS